MGWTVDRNKTFERVVVSPDGERATVYVRKLNYGDMQDRKNEMLKQKVVKGPDGQWREQQQYNLGGLAIFDIMRGVAKWELPLKLKEATIRDLDPAVSGQLLDHVREVNPQLRGMSAFADLAELDDEDDEGDEGDDGDNPDGDGDDQDDGGDEDGEPGERPT